ncbi:MAG: hypothetical protein AB7S26_13105 [Sandaracinaceae bacterium]
MDGSRVTDATMFHVRRGELRGALRVVRSRQPERFRWRQATFGVSQAAAGLIGLERMRIEEPLRELVVDLPDRDLQREVVLDARKAGVDFDRGELLPRLTLADLRRYAFITHTDVSRIARYTKLPAGFGDAIDTAACVVIGRAISEHHRRRAHKLWLSVPDPDGPERLWAHHRIMLDRAERERDESEAWHALTKALLNSAG